MLWPRLQLPGWSHDISHDSLPWSPAEMTSTPQWDSEETQLWCFNKRNLLHLRQQVNIIHRLWQSWHYLPSWLSIVQSSDCHVCMLSRSMTALVSRMSCDNQSVPQYPWLSYTCLLRCLHLCIFIFTSSHSKCHRVCFIKYRWQGRREENSWEMTQTLCHWKCLTCVGVVTCLLELNPGISSGAVWLTQEKHFQQVWNRFSPVSLCFEYELFLDFTFCLFCI